MRRADLRGGDFRGAIMLDVDMRRADLRGGDFRHAIMFRVDLTGAMLEASTLASRS